MTIEAHAFDLRVPGFHGATSLTARCSQGCWSRSVFTDAGAPPASVFEREMQARQAAHVVEQRADDRERERLEALWTPMSEEDAKYKRSMVPRGGANATNFGPPADFPVTHLRADGVALLHPRGWKRGRVQVLPSVDQEAEHAV